MISNKTVHYAMWYVDEYMPLKVSNNCVQLMYFGWPYNHSLNSIIYCWHATTTCEQVIKARDKIQYTLDIKRSYRKKY